MLVVGGGGAGAEGGGAGAEERVACTISPLKGRLPVKNVDLLWTFAKGIFR